MPRSTKFNRLIVAGIAAAAIAPASAVASSAVDGGVAAPETQDMRAPDQVAGGVAAPDTQDMRAPDQVAGGAPGTGVVQDMRAPDQVDGSPVGSSQPGPPQWAANPQPIASRHVAATSTPSVSTDDGVDDGVLIAIGGGALLLVGGLGIAGRKRLQVARQRQLA
jgi:hypothetical protein